MVRTAFFRRAAFLVFCLIAAASTPAFAQAVGDACTGADRIYTSAGTNNSDLICNGTTLQLELLHSVKAGPVQKGIATASPQVTLDVNGEVRPGNTSIACSASTGGALRYNAATSKPEFCNGTAWASYLPQCNALPDDFSFPTLTGVTPGSQPESAVLRITGIGCPTATVSISGTGSPEFLICSAYSPGNGCTVVQNWTSTATTIASNRYLRLHLTASSANNTTRTATVTVGGLARTWSVTTSDIGTAGTSYKLVFLASGNRTGNLGGVAGADAICASDATSAGLSGTFKAWVATSAADDPESRFTKATVPYRETTGHLVAQSWTDLTDGNIYGVMFQANGTQHSGAPIWTNVMTDGTVGSGPSCTNWTTASSGTSGAKGGYNGQDSTWTQNGTATCDTWDGTFICFQQ